MTIVHHGPELDFQHLHQPLAIGGAELLEQRTVLADLGRKFLLAGRGGLNLTHSEPLERFVERYGERSNAVAGWLAEFGPEQLRAWAKELGTQTFVGSSGRVFPSDMKAAPLLRSWLLRLRGHGVAFHMRHRWTGGLGADLRFTTPTGEVPFAADATVLALGGASWAKLGSDGAWVPWLERHGIAVAPLEPANCGFDVGWSPYFAEHFAGSPLKSITLTFTDSLGATFCRTGEAMVTATGLEGSLIYAASARLRAEIKRRGSAPILLDLAPGRNVQDLESGLERQRAKRSVADQLRESAGITGVKLALIRERLTASELAAALARDPRAFARQIKAWPVVLRAPRPIDEAISTAGGVRFEALDERLMLRARPGVFCCGEMLDWEAPTGGYLLTACFASGRVAGRGALAWCREKRMP